MNHRDDEHPTPRLSPDTIVVAAGRDRRPGSPLNTPPVPASNFVLGSGRAYARDDGTPGWEALEDIVGRLEGGRSVAFASGMAGIAAIFDRLPAGAQIVLPVDCYQGVAGLADSATTGACGVSADCPPMIRSGGSALRPMPICSGWNRRPIPCWSWLT